MRFCCADKRSKQAASRPQLQLQHPFLWSPFIEEPSTELTFLALSRKSCPSWFSSTLVGVVSVPQLSRGRLCSFKDSVPSFETCTGIVLDSWLISQILANLITRSASSVFVDSSSLRLYESAVSKKYKFLTNFVVANVFKAYRMFQILSFFLYDRFCEFD